MDPFATQAQVDQAGQAITDGEQQLAAGQAQLDASARNWRPARHSWRQQNSSWWLPVLPAAAIEAQLGQQKAALADGQAKLDAGAQELEASKAKLALGKRQAEASAAIRFVSEDGQAAVAQVQFNTSINGLSPEVRQQVQDIAHGTSSAGVTAYASKEITEDISELFGIAEIIGIAVAALVLIIMLGTLVAAGLPLLMAIMGVGVGVGITFALSGLFDMSSISPMLALMLGLAVGIDYSLFIVNRHRTQLLAGMDPEESVARATGTSGNAVVFAGLTVIIALAALVVPGLPFLAVMGLAAAGTVAVAVLVAITLTPAMLSLIGRRIISKRAWAKADAAQRRARPRSGRRRQGPRTQHPRLGRPGHPASRALPSWPALSCWATLALPATQLQLALPDGGSEPVESEAYQAYDLTARSFGEGVTGPIVAVGEFPAGLDEAQAQTLQYDIADKLRASGQRGGSRSGGLSEDRRTAVFQVIPEEGPASASTVKVVSELRGLNGEIQSDYDVSHGPDRSDRRQHRRLHQARRRPAARTWRSSSASP